MFDSREVEKIEEGERKTRGTKCGRDEKRSKNGRWRASTVDQVENCSLVDVNQYKSVVWSMLTIDKCRMVNVDQVEKFRLHFSTSQCRPSCTFQLVDGRQRFSSRPKMLSNVKNLRQDIFFSINFQLFNLFESQIRWRT